MSEFQKLRVETSKIQNEFKEKPGYVEDKLHKNTQEICQQILKKQGKSQKSQENQNAFIENLMSELKTAKSKLNETENQISDLHEATKQQESQANLWNDLVAKISDKNLEMMLKIQKSQDLMIMKMQEGSAVQDVPIETEKSAKNGPFFEILVIWTDSRGPVVPGNHGKLRVCGSDTIRQIKPRINSLAGIDTISFRTFCDDKFLEDDHTLAHYNIREGSTICVFFH